MRSSSCANNIIPQQASKPLQQVRETHMFQPGDIVLRKVFENTVDPSIGKFQPNWEGPYIVTRPDESELYALDKLDETPIPRMWNVMHLKRYYQ